MKTFLVKFSITLLTFTLPGVASAGAAQEAAAKSPQVSGETILDGLSERAEFNAIRVSPDGRHVAFSTRRRLPREDKIEFTVAVLPLDEPSAPTVLGRYKLSHHVEGATVAQASEFEWSADGRKLLYTTGGEEMELRLWNEERNQSQTLLVGYAEIHFVGDTPNKKEVKLDTSNPSEKNETAYDGVPKDKSLRMKDNYLLFGPLNNPKLSPPTRLESWEFRWEDSVLMKSAQANRVEYLARPAEYPVVLSLAGTPDGNSIITQDLAFPSPDGTKSARFQFGHLNEPRSAKESRMFTRITIQAGRERGPQTSTSDESKSFLGWSPDSNEVFFIERRPTTTALCALSVTGALRTIHEEDALFDPATATSAVFNMSPDAHYAVLVRSTNLTAEELVMVDLSSGKVTVLYAPNTNLQAKNYAMVRYILIDDRCAGHLYLPTGQVQSKPRPLVFAPIVSGPGFAISNPGDELPILALVEHGMAVFALDCIRRTPVTFKGAKGLDLTRDEGPRLAMEYLVGQLSRQDIIDRDRIGVSGLSTGAEIAMYSYWKSDLFRAVSSSASSWSPAMFVLGGLNYATDFELVGLGDPSAGAYPDWKKVSAALNARKNLPPLLWQTSDSERVANLETWFRLRRAGAPVEWYEYPNEGHVKEGPANKWWVYQRNLDWFRFWLQDYEDPDPAKAEQYARWHRLRDLRESAPKQQTVGSR